MYTVALLWLYAGIIGVPARIFLEKNKVYFYHFDIIIDIFVDVCLIFGFEVVQDIGLMLMAFASLSVIIIVHIFCYWDCSCRYCLFLWN